VPAYDAGIVSPIGSGWPIGTRTESCAAVLPARPRLVEVALSIRLGLCVLAAAVLAAVPGRAADPVALVEDVSGSPPGIQPMDYLAVATVIHLEAKDGVIIDYLHSCVRETIEGGQVTIGTDQSVVAGGSLKRETVECDGGTLHLTADQAAKSGVVVFRKPPKPGQAPVDRTLYGASPVVELKGGGRLVVERLDKPGERLDLKLASADLEHGAFYDFARTGRSFTAGGVYRASANGHAVVFKIAAAAKPGAAPLAGRLLLLR
jgi:hypothetical protein